MLVFYNKKCDFVFSTGIGIVWMNHQVAEGKAVMQFRNKQKIMKESCHRVPMYMDMFRQMIQQYCTDMDWEELQKRGDQ